MLQNNDRIKIQIVRIFQRNLFPRTLISGQNTNSLFILLFLYTLVPRIDSFIKLCNFLFQLSCSEYFWHNLALHIKQGTRARFAVTRIYVFDHGKNDFVSLQNESRTAMIPYTQLENETIRVVAPMVNLMFYNLYIVLVL